MAKGKTVQEFIAELSEKSAVAVANTLSKKVLSAEIVSTNRPKRAGFNAHGTDIKNIDSWLKAKSGDTEYIVVLHTPKPRKGEPTVKTFYKKAA